VSTAQIEDCTSACQTIGRTSISAARVRDLGGAQDGLQLDVLEADAAALAAAASTAEEALGIAAAAAGVLAQAWRSGTGSAATEFLNRQCTSGRTVVDDLAAAADTVRQLRDELAAQIRVCETVTASVESRIRESPGWLDAARAVLSGRADAVAVGMVGGEIAPYIETTVAGEWAPAMASAAAGVTAAYRRATAALSGATPVRFETPAMPAAAPKVGSAHAAGPAPGPAPALMAAPQIPAPSPSAPPLPDLGGALLPLVTAIAAALGGYSGSPLPGTADPAGETGPAGPREPELEATPTRRPEPGPTPKPTPTPDPAPADAPAPGTPVAAPAPPPPALPAPTLPPPLAAEAPPGEPSVDSAATPGRTPCEIAADELPQVGG